MDIALMSVILCRMVVLVIHMVPVKDKNLWAVRIIHLQVDIWRLARVNVQRAGSVL